MSIEEFKKVSEPKVNWTYVLGHNALQKVDGGSTAHPVF